MAIWKRTNNDMQYTTQKTKDRATRILLKIEDETQVFRNVDIYKWEHSQWKNLTHLSRHHINILRHYINTSKHYINTLGY